MEDYPYALEFVESEGCVCPRCGGDNLEWDEVSEGGTGSFHCIDCDLVAIPVNAVIGIVTEDNKTVIFDAVDLAGKEEK